MKKIINIILTALFLAVNLLKNQFDLASTAETCLFGFALGLVLGLVLTGLYVFIYKIIRPENKIRFGISERVTAGLICAILWSIFI